jgi:putative transposase
LRYAACRVGLSSGLVGAALAARDYEPSNFELNRQLVGAALAARDYDTGNFELNRQLERQLRIMQENKLLVEMPKRRSPRLRGFDYSRGGAYFVTLCSKDRKCLFGEIVEVRMQPSNIGSLVAACWNDVFDAHPFVSLDHWILMPNHLHAIVRLDDSTLWTKPLWKVIATFKAKSTSKVRTFMGSAACSTLGAALAARLELWQRSFYEHVIRDENELLRIRQYVVDNPAQWAVDSENPDFVRSGSKTGETGKAGEAGKTGG